jgi:AraC family transcriptional regulator
MSMLEQTATAPSFIGADPPTDLRWGELRPRIGPRVDLHTTLPGLVVVEAASDHRLLVHAGAPVPGSYRSRRVLYTRGDIDLFPAGSSENWEADEASTALLLHLPPSLLQRAAEDMGRDPARSGLELRCQIRDPQIEHIAWALDADRRAGHPSGLLYTESLGLALAVHLLGSYTVPRKLARGLSKQELRRVTAYIEDHLDQDLSLTQLSDVAQMSGSHLKTLFRHSMGVAVHEYVVQRRVERARSLLLRGELPASQVALEAGFAHQSHMARSMRRVLGVTPTTLVRNSRGS